MYEFMLSHVTHLLNNTPYQAEDSFYRITFHKIVWSAYVVVAMRLLILNLVIPTAGAPYQVRCPSCIV
jgi:hypothetical protein